MEVFRVSRDVYGREVLQGMSWDLVWLFLAAGVVFAIAHALYRRLLAPGVASAGGRAEMSGQEGAAQGRVVRHTLAARLGHWLVAACVLVLLATSLLPVFGVEFAWVTAHWVSGVVLVALVATHTLRSLPPRRLRRVWIGRADLAEMAAVARIALRRSRRPPPLPGKYSPAQKLIHHAFALVVLAACVTGLMMLAKVDTPWWERNPYVFSDATWALVYVLHGLATLLLIPMVLVHAYFALRREKRPFLRAMARGWFSRAEYESHHDPQRWETGK